MSGWFLLVHGGATTGRFWDRLVPELARPALAPTLVGQAHVPADLFRHTVDDQVAALVEVVGREDPAPEEHVVIVAHSRGGLVVPGVCEAMGERVAHVVLNAASVPPPGGCGLDCMQDRHRRRTELALAAHDSDGLGDTLPPVPSDPDAVRTTYGGAPLDDATAAFMLDPVRNVRDSVSVFTTPVDYSTVVAPITYVRANQDRIVPPALQEVMRRRLDACAVVELDTGHIPAVTHPAQLAALLERIANESIGG